jgi:hypothetical protein
MKINIICLKWGEKYNSDYVNRLYHAVKRNTTISFKFHCFTDDPSEINSEIIIHELPYKNIESWWNKLYLFSDEIDIPQGDKIFYIDLDTLIVDNIDDIVSHDDKKIIVLKDFLNGIAATAGEMGSGLMSWRHGDYTYIWTKFINDPNQAIKSVEPFGDQQWIDQCVKDRSYWQEIFPDRIVSFKVHCRSGLPENASIICYHGKPNIPESATFKGKIWKFEYTPQSWVLDYWR